MTVVTVSVFQWHLLLVNEVEKAFIVSRICVVIRFHLTQFIYLQNKV